MEEVKGVCMTDKTAIEKALRALYGWIKAEVEHFGATCPDDFIIEMVENALAAIESEKPAEDAFEGFYKNRFTGMIYDGTEFKKIAHEIWQYAESYHAEQCKACRKDRQPLPEAPK
jgi:hypothetical protein